MKHTKNSRVLTLGLAVLLCGSLMASSPAWTQGDDFDDDFDADVDFEAEDACVVETPRRVGSQHRACNGKKEGPCAVWSPPLSDVCRARSDRLAGLDIEYTYFGEVDCRSNPRREPVTMVVIHNGDYAKNNNYNWQCRLSAAHYTIDRDGTIYQHIGEERSASHAGRVNQRSIGIELQIKRGYGGTCNSLAEQSLARAAAFYDKSEDDIILELCTPSFDQYEALNLLIEDISSRHPIADDGVVGHCEVAPPNGHRDPRAFDWEYIGLSNATKLASIEGSNKPCDAYDLTQDTPELFWDDEDVCWAGDELDDEDVCWSDEELQER